MSQRCSVQDAIDQLERDPLRHVVLLKHLQAYPEQVEIYRTGSTQGAAMLIMLAASTAPYDRQSYPDAAVVALIVSDHADLTALRHVGGERIIRKPFNESELARKIGLALPPDVTPPES